MLLLNNIPIFWKSKKQPVTARSSAEAEVYALDSAVSNARYINWKREEFNNKVTWPMVVYVDNNQAEVFCKNLNVNSNVNPADILTKPHDAGRFADLLALCNPINIIT